MNISLINHWAVLVCALLFLGLGALWYSPLLFFQSWKQENGFNDQMIQNANPLLAQGIGFLLAWLMAYNMAFFLADETTDAWWGVTAGFLTGFGWAAPIFTAIALFEQKSWRYIAINAGFIMVYFVLIGWILGIWR